MPDEHRDNAIVEAETDPGGDERMPQPAQRDIQLRGVPDSRPGLCHVAPWR
jgi:hypothetical protein